MEIVEPPTGTVVYTAVYVVPGRVVILILLVLLPIAFQLSLRTLTVVLLVLIIVLNQLVIIGGLKELL